MKPAILNVLIVASLALAGGPAIAQTSAPATTQQTTSAQPSTTTPDNAKYVKNPRALAGCEKQVALFKDKPCDIIFIGDSITAFWLTRGKAIWEAQFAPRNALDFGISGDTTQNVLWRLDNMDIKHLRPKVAVVLIGTNNWMKTTPQQVADGVRAVLEKTKSMFPGVKIILVSIMPNQRANDTMMAADAIIKDFADESSIYFLDLVPIMTPIVTATPDGKSDTNWKGLSKDHLHPDASGYQMWADAMEPLLKKLLAGG